MNLYRPILGVDTRACQHTSNRQIDRWKDKSINFVSNATVTNKWIPSLFASQITSQAHCRCLFLRNNLKEWRKMQMPIKLLHAQTRNIIKFKENWRWRKLHDGTNTVTKRRPWGILSDDACAWYGAERGKLCCTEVQTRTALSLCVAFLKQHRS